MELVLTNEDKRWSEDAMYRVMTKFYQAVIAPKMATKDDIEELKGGLDGLRTDFKRLDLKVDGIEEKVASLEKAFWKVSDHQGKKLDNHEERITALEAN